MPAPPEASLWTDVPKLTDACYRSMRTTFFHVQDTQEEQDYCRAWCPARPVATAVAGAEMGGELAGGRTWLKHRQREPCLAARYLCILLSLLSALHSGSRR